MSPIQYKSLLSTGLVTRECAFVVRVLIVSVVPGQREITLQRANQPDYLSYTPEDHKKISNQNRELVRRYRLRPSRSQSSAQLKSRKPRKPIILKTATIAPQVWSTVNSSQQDSNVENTTDERTQYITNIEILSIHDHATFKGILPNKCILFQIIQQCSPDVISNLLHRLSKDALRISCRNGSSNGNKIRKNDLWYDGGGISPAHRFNVSQGPSNHCQDPKRTSHRHSRLEIEDGIKIN